MSVELPEFKTFTCWLRCFSSFARILLTEQFQAAQFSSLLSVSGVLFWRGERVKGYATRSLCFKTHSPRWGMFLTGVCWPAGWECGPSDSRAQQEVRRWGLTDSPRVREGEGWRSKVRLLWRKGQWEERRANEVVIGAEHRQSKQIKQPKSHFTKKKKWNSKQNFRFFLSFFPNFCSFCCPCEDIWHVSTATKQTKTKKPKDCRNNSHMY